MKSCWLVILPYRSFYMLGEMCTKAEAEYAARLIWFNAEVE